MSEKKKTVNPVAAAAALAGLISTMGAAAPAQALQKVNALRNAKAGEVAGGIMSHAVQQRDQHAQATPEVGFLQFLQFLQFGQVIIFDPVAD